MVLPDSIRASAKVPKRPPRDQKKVITEALEAQTDIKQGKYHLTYYHHPKLQGMPKSEVKKSSLADNPGYEKYLNKLNEFHILSSSKISFVGRGMVDSKAFSG